MRQMSLPSSRQSFFFIPFLLLFFNISSATQNHEASILFAWLHSSSSSQSPRPPSFSTWKNHDPNPCNWTFITCSPQIFVTEINILTVPLQLPLPSNLSSFPFLRKLIISYTNLTETISVNIGACQELQVIDLSSNNLVGPIPSTISKLHKLTNLILNSNQLTGKIPVELSNCSSLQNLLLFGNSLSGSIPSELGRLSSLEVLRVGGNIDIVGKIPLELGNCGNLTVLGLAETQVSGSIPTSFGHLSKLRTLAIYTTMVSGEIPPELAQSVG